tara:strand:+ start:8535 stop:9356 length:822 start_codon:yes stop_codon:yes gene_type:complete
MSYKKLIKKILSRSSLGKKYIDERNPLGCSSTALRQLKNKYKGKRCFIIGNGPSLNKIDLSLLKDEYTFGVNGIFYKTNEMGFTPTFYVVEDRHVMADNVDAINSFNVKYKFFPSVYKKYIDKNPNTFFFNMNTGYYNETSDFYCLPRFSLDASKRLFCGQSVTMINLQLAHHLGFSEVYLVGMDHSYVIPDNALIDGETIESTDDDPNHFHPDYFGKGKKWHDPHLDRVERSYQYMNMAYDATGRKIFNATVGGNLDVFQRKNFIDLFKDAE